MDKKQFDTLMQGDIVIALICINFFKAGRGYEVIRTDGTFKVYVKNDAGKPDYMSFEFFEKTCMNNNPGTQPNPEAKVEFQAPNPQFENQYQVLSHLLLHPNKRVCIDFRPQVEVGFKDGQLWNFLMNKPFPGIFKKPSIWRKVKTKKYLYAYKFKNREPQVSVSLCRDDTDATSKIAGDSRSQLEWIEMIESSVQEVE